MLAVRIEARTHCIVRRRNHARLRAHRPSDSESEEAIRAFRSEAAFDAWLCANHARETEIWLRIYRGLWQADRHQRAGAGRRVVLELIDGIRKAL